MTTIVDIIIFLEDLSGRDKIKPDTDIFKEVKLVGDDFHEMIEKYSKKFNVNMSGYLWYFHTNEEGSSFLGGGFFKPPYERVERIPVTPQLLLSFVNKGKWDIEYPEHRLPKRRYDLLINKIFLMLIFLALIVVLILKIKV